LFFAFIVIFGDGWREDRYIEMDREKERGNQKVHDIHKQHAGGWGLGEGRETGVKGLCVCVLQVTST